MRRGEAYRHLQLVSASGRPVELPFLEIEEELWDRDGRRLMVAGFRGLLTEQPRLPTQEVESVRFVAGEGTGPQPWDCVADLVILRRALGRNSE